VCWTLIVSLVYQNATSVPNVATVPIVSKMTKNDSSASKSWLVYQQNDCQHSVPIGVPWWEYGFRWKFDHFSFRQWKNFENPLRIDEVITHHHEFGVLLFGPQCILNIVCLLLDLDYQQSARLSMSSSSSDGHFFFFFNAIR